MNGWMKRVLCVCVRAWALGPVVLAAILGAHVAVYRVWPWKGKHWRLAENIGLVAPSPESTGRTIGDELGLGGNLRQKLAEIEIVDGSLRKAVPALVLEISGAPGIAELKAIRSPFFGDRADLPTALADTLANEQETQRLVRVDSHDNVLRLDIGGGVAYRRQSLVHGILVESVKP
jgi:hypothetical protein